MTPDWAAGMKRISDGVYVDANEHMHLDLEGMCLGAGVPPTKANCELMASVARQMFEEQYGVRVNEVDGEGNPL
jgi:hypothetical protein